MKDSTINKFALFCTLLTTILSGFILGYVYFDSERNLNLSATDLAESTKKLTEIQAKLNQLNVDSFDEIKKSQKELTKSTISLNEQVSKLNKTQTLISREILKKEIIPDPEVALEIGRAVQRHCTYSEKSWINFVVNIINKSSRSCIVDAIAIRFYLFDTSVNLCEINKPKSISSLNGPRWNLYWILIGEEIQTSNEFRKHSRSYNLTGINPKNPKLSALKIADGFQFASLLPERSNKVSTFSFIIPHDDVIICASEVILWFRYTDPDGKIQYKKNNRYFCKAFSKSVLR